MLIIVLGLFFNALPYPLEKAEKLLFFYFIKIAVFLRSAIKMLLSFDVVVEGSFLEIFSQGHSQEPFLGTNFR